MRRCSGVIGVLFFSSAAIACGHSTGGTEPPKTSAKTSELPQLPPGPKDPYATTSAPSFPEAEDTKLTPLDRPHHERAREAVRAGRLAEAKRLLGRLAAAYPDHQLLVDQYNIVCAMIDKVRASAKASLEAAAVKTPAPPPVKYTLIRGGPSTGDIPKLVKASQKKNGVVDDGKWFIDNDIRLPIYFVPPPSDLLFAPGVISSTSVVNTMSGFVYTEYTQAHRFSTEPLPLQVPLAYGTAPLHLAIDAKAYIIAVYGEQIVAVFDSPDHVAGVLDFGNYVHPPADRVGQAVVGHARLVTPEGTRSGNITVTTHSITHEIRFASAKDGVLYIEHANMSYAKENGGQTAYVSAIDIAGGELLWRSAPLAANAWSFSIVRDAIICGYGFTAEPDFLYVLDRGTGATKQKVPISTSPESIALKQGSLFVQGYDTDFVFDVR